ncbi:MAG: YicC family protein [Candidatus Omnitrophica bacterium]|nr:YicC family protein [Candidatus Omnitrophota bacterium]MDD5236364.1 YicC family protein [Candidatus Omnitrophota bacterium]MDD5610701.1 YicC family protein [Candidatus Omnitrophota bacterium]
MFNSMTGFGSALRDLKGIGKIELQLRSINQRFLETIFHLPEEFAYLEDMFRALISKRLSRGRINCSLRLDGSFMDKSIFDEARLFAYHKQLKRLNQKLDLKTPPDLGLLLSLPGVMVTRPKYKEIPLAVMRSLFNRALDKLIQQRKKEGAALYKDIKGRIQKLNFYLAKLEERFRRAVSQKVKNIANCEEKTSFLKGSDITEELVRIKFHLKNFTQQMNKNGASGKELDFITQELAREANTVGAKSIDALVSGYVVKIKSEIDKIREQLQNVE